MYRYEYNTSDKSYWIYSPSGLMMCSIDNEYDANLLVTHLNR